MNVHYILSDVQKASVRPCALETQMSDVADGSFVRRFLPLSLCSSWARLIGAAVLVLRYLAAALLTCAAAVEHRVCVCVTPSSSAARWKHGVSAHTGEPQLCRRIEEESVHRDSHHALAIAKSTCVFLDMF